MEHPSNDLVDKTEYEEFDIASNRVHSRADGPDTTRQTESSYLTQLQFLDEEPRSIKCFFPVSSYLLLFLEIGLFVYFGLVVNVMVGTGFFGII